MHHCTVCGAAAREGARFCTSCGARLVDSHEPAAADETAITPIESADAGDPPALANDSPAEASTTTFVASDEPEGRDAAVDTPAFEASWPSSEEPSEQEPEPVTAPAPDSFATDAAQDSEPRILDTAAPDAEPVPEREDAQEPVADDTAAAADVDPGTEQAASTTDWGWGTATPQEEPPAVTEEPEDDHHGASQWESWAPVAAGAGTVEAAEASATHHEDAASLKELLGELATRIDRFLAPTSVAARNVDADNLADQLAQWSKPVPNTGELLDAVRAVRKAPRDVDALSRLATHAADLELLVQHYQSITQNSGRWARDLRVAREATDSAK